MLSNECKGSNKLDGRGRYWFTWEGNYISHIEKPPIRLWSDQTGNIEWEEATIVLRSKNQTLKQGDE